VVIAQTVRDSAWQASPHTGQQAGAWFVAFHDGSVGPALNFSSFHGRAVRGGR